MTCDIDYIKELLARYLDGETSVEEQNVITEYLQSEDVPEELLIYKEMFGMLSCPQDVPSDDELKAFAASNGLELREDIQESSRRTVWMLPFVKYAGIAAASVILFVLGYSVGNRKPAEIKEVEKERIVEVTKMQHDTVTVTVEKVIYRSIAEAQTAYRHVDSLDNIEEKNPAVSEEYASAGIPISGDARTMDGMFEECARAIREMENMYKQ
ncbi:MAG: hypothetical protein NC206_11245 [Bacteroides sp.]|nr:hypothetical protein [Roseburia sp.]MCM1347643.1 hypothetical protein [Bacteroides sp.]MCM1422078.1 hypothetical protein [Bacteroides sp.]